jgi:putative ABC transport system permease protein
VTKFALKGLLGRKLRTALTAFAIVLGVAMVSGTYVLTDSIDKAFDSIFTESRAGSSVVISGKSAFDISDDSGVSNPLLDESLLAKVRDVRGVGAAEGSVDGEAQIIGDNGKAIVYGGAPNLGFSIANGDSVFNPLTLQEGKWPGDGEVAIDEATADKENFAIGRTIGVQGDGPVERLRISGFFRFGSVSTIGGATLAGFDLPTAQRIFDKKGKLDEIAVAAAQGVPESQLVEDLKQILPATAEVRLASEQAEEDAEDTNEFITFLQGFLLAFAGIALFVGSFVIANSLSITIAQRTREFATIRTLGGSRRQVLRSIIVEALVVGTLASIVGLVSGLALAKGLFKLFDAVGFTLPNQGLLLETRTIIVSLLVGILVTLLASLRPAVRATRVPPIAAVREGATLPESRFARFRTVGSLGLTALGFAALAYGLFGSGLGTTQILLWMGIGALLIFIGVALFSSRLVVPLASVGGPFANAALIVAAVLFYPAALAIWLIRNWLLSAGRSPVRQLTAIALSIVLVAAQLVILFTVLREAGSLSGFLLVLAVNVAVNGIVAYVIWRIARGRGEHDWPIDMRPDRVSTELAEGNARRNPQRTASTAAALMIGLALVTLVATLAAGITSTFRGAVNDIFTSDYAITAQNNYSPIPIDAGEAVANVPGVEAVASARTGEARIFGDVEFVTAVEKDADKVLTLEWKEGSQQTLSTLGEDGAFVDEDYAKDHNLHVGSPISVQVPSGNKLQLKVNGIFDPPAGGSPFGHVTFSSTTFDREYVSPKNLYTFVQMRGGVDAANTRALESALKEFPNAKSQTRDEFVDNQISGLNDILNILYVLLALSVIVSLFGIVNTLVLTVFERTRELGMLRAIGMTRRQTRRMIRHESVITALIGGVLGIILGIVLGALLIARVEFIEFSLPTGQIIVFAVATILVGILAAIFPARRAAKLDPLKALQYE